MSAPQPSPAEEDEGSEEPPEGFDDVADADDPAEVEVDLADTNIGEEVDEDIDEAFDRIENADRPNDPADNDDFDPFGDYGDDGDGDSGSSGSGGDASGEDIADAIVEGTARLAVLGLDDEFEINGEQKTKSDLQDEFKEVFTAFRLGEFGGEVAEEYLFVEEDIDPLMGFAAACLCCTAMVLWMRPDGEDIAKDAYNRVATIGTGGLL